MIDIISRQAWRARPATWDHPARERRDHVISICFGKEFKRSKPETMNFLRWMQHYCMWHLDFHDIRYNFMIGEDGTIYEGRGWTEAPFLPDMLQLSEENSFLLGIIGPFKVTNLPYTMGKARDDLISYGIKNDYIQENFQRRTVEKNREKDNALPVLDKPDF